MLFDNSIVLKLLPVLIVLLFIFYLWAERSYGRAVSRFSRGESLRVITPADTIRARRVGAALFFGIIILASISLAGPRYGGYWKESVSGGIDLLIALDVSKSMLAEDIKPDRLTFAKNEIRTLSRKVSGGRLALTAFSGDAFLFCPFTQDRVSFMRILDNVDTDSPSRGGTSFYAVIHEAVRAFQNSGISGRRDVLIIGDGEDNSGEFDKAIEMAVREGICVSAIGVGTEDGAPVPGTAISAEDDMSGISLSGPVITKLDETSLEKIVAETGGYYKRAIGPESGALHLFEKFYKSIDEKSGDKEFSKVLESRYRIPLLAAIVLLLADIFLLFLVGDHEN
jgi:Ca-activated chloride channel homolog